MPEITDVRFPHASEEEAIASIIAERSRKRFFALFGIALALFAVVVATYLSYA